MKLEKIIRLEKSFAEWTENIYRNAGRFMWDFQFVNEAFRKQILENDAYKRLPRYAHSFVEGVRHVLERQHEKLVEWSYEVNGKRLLLTDPRYRKIPAQTINEKHSHTGCFVYKSDTTKFWTHPK